MPAGSCVGHTAACWNNINRHCTSTAPRSRLGCSHGLILGRFHVVARLTTAPAVHATWDMSNNRALLLWTYWTPETAPTEHLLGLLVPRSLARSTSRNLPSGRQGQPHAGSPHMLRGGQGNKQCKAVAPLRACRRWTSAKRCLDVCSDEVMSHILSVCMIASEWRPAPRSTETTPDACLSTTRCIRI